MAVNASDEDGWTSLMDAADNSNDGLVNELLSAKADIDIVGKKNPCVAALMQDHIAHARKCASSCDFSPPFCQFL